MRWSHNFSDVRPNENRGASDTCPSEELIWEQDKGGVVDGRVQGEHVAEGDDEEVRWDVDCSDGIRPHNPCWISDVHDGNWVC